MKKCSECINEMFPFTKCSYCVDDSKFSSVKKHDDAVSTLLYGYDVAGESLDNLRRSVSKLAMREYLLNKIKKVIFNDPATIVFWDDGTKTVVKAVNEPFDKEKGLAMAIAKYFFGNKGYYYEVFEKWIY